MYWGLRLCVSYRIAFSAVQLLLFQIACRTKYNGRALGTLQLGGGTEGARIVALDQSHGLRLPQLIIL